MFSTLDILYTIIDGIGDDCEVEVSTNDVGGLTFRALWHVNDEPYYVRRKMTYCEITETNSNMLVENFIEQVKFCKEPRD